MSNRWSFWDGLVFGFTASLTLWQDLPPAEVVMVLAAMFGAALITLVPESEQDTATQVSPGADQSLKAGVSNDTRD